MTLHSAKLSRRQALKLLGVGAAAFHVPAVAMANALKGTAINHISYQSVDYKKTRDFYVEFLGFQTSDEDDKQLYLWAGNVVISAKNTPKTPGPIMDHLGVTLDSWDVKAVQSALKERGLQARLSTNDPHDANQKSVFTRDPNNYSLQLCAKDLEVKPAPAASKSPLKALGINHLSYQCADFKTTRDFYVDLLSAKVTNDDGKQAYVWFGGDYIVVRNSPTGNIKPLIDHIGWTIADWNVDRVMAELKKRGMDGRPDAQGKSVVTKDLNGYPLQLCSKDL